MPHLDPTPVSLTAHIRLMAQYNTWMNEKIFQAASSLSAEQLAQPRGAYFGSLIGTLNHIAVGDTIWLHRLSQHPAMHPALDALRRAAPPTSLTHILHTDFAQLRAHRVMLDDVMTRWAGQIADDDLSYALEYKNMRAIASNKNFFSLIMNLFNHQTHHRGQVTTMLSQAGVDVDATDLLELIPNVF